MQPSEAYILTLLVDNEFGVLTRITAQIRREGWNIRSITAQQTEEPAIARVTVALECFHSTLPSVAHRLSRLASVRSVTVFDPDRFLCSELALVRAEDLDAVHEIASRFGAEVAAREEGSLVLRLAGQPNELDAFLDALRAEGAVTAARTGAITLEKR